MEKKRGLLDVLIKHVHILRGAKFNVLLNIIMTPHVVNNFQEISEYFESQGLSVIPKVIRGIYDGKHYPTSYTFEDKRLIYEYILQARQEYRSVKNYMGEAPSINMFKDNLFLNGVKDYRGILCRAGSNFVVILPNGTVARCNAPDRLGNILFRNVNLLKAPKLCDTAHCPYFCEKYSIDYARPKITLLNFLRKELGNLKGILLRPFKFR